ncbi:MAG: hypothetical protein OEV81_17630 [Betaproteobacteria bacterium]|nr:hypothetical protein [Betaproteobacteria bacterium]MDH5219735.1 hypothetical protein [Betaproteobacteria bacterium]MDH5350482.1 hypothetical protein [Betaproteobacteria bacterium]
MPQALLVPVALAAMTAFTVPARAEGEPLPDRLMLRLGGYSVNDAEQLVRLDANNAPVGAYIDFAETLGGETSTNVIRLDGRYRFDDRHALGFAWYTLKFDGHRVLQTDISWGDVDFATGTTVDSKIEFDVYKINYQYSLYNKPEVELGALVGLHVMGTSIGINAVGISQARTESLTAPLPVWGLFARYNFTPRLMTYFNYQFFFVNYDDRVKGGLQDFLLGLEYRATRTLGLGAAFNRFGINLEAKEDAATLFYDSSWTGLMLYGSLYF